MSDIGQAIAGPPEEEVRSQGAVQDFVTNPKNLATLLVLGAAMASPRGRDVSPLAHGLRAGVGALGFRGGLEKGMIENRQEAAEAQSVLADRESQAQFREDQAATARSGVEATVQGNAMQLISDREQREMMLRLAEIEKGTRGTAKQALADKILASAYEGYMTALNDPLNREIEPQELFNRNMGPAMVMLAQLDALPEGLVGGFEPVEDPALAPAPEDKSVIDTIVEATTGRGGAEPGPAFGGRTVPAYITSSTKPNASAEAINRTLKGSLAPKEVANLTPDEIITQAGRIQQEAQSKLEAGMSVEEATRWRRDPYKWKMISRDQQRAILSILKKDIKVSGSL